MTENAASSRAPSAKPGALLSDHPAGTVPPPGLLPHQKPGYEFYGDVMRVLIMFVVVFAHPALGLVYYPHPENPPIDTFHWALAIATSSFGHGVVIGLIMLSGRFLLDPKRDEPLGRFFQRRLTRVGIPLIFWSGFFMVWPYIFSDAAAYNRPELEHLRGWSGLVLGVPYYHMHFMFIVVGLYLVAPALKLVVRHGSRSMLWFIVIAATVLGMADNAVRAWQNEMPHAFERFWPFIGFFVAGYLLKDTVIRGRALVVAWAVTIIATAAATLLTDWFVIGLDFGWGVRGEYWTDFLSPMSVAIAFATFLIFRSHFSGPMPQRRWARWIVAIAPATLGIYLFHPIYIDVIAQITSSGKNTLPLPIFVQLILGGVALYALSFFAVAAIQRIPWIRTIMG